MADDSAGRELYLELLKRCLINWIYSDAEPSFYPELRIEGRDVPPFGHTMIGVRRLDNLHDAIDDVLARGVPGDFIETGVWRGGASIFMRGALKAHGVTDRTVWVADSFKGLPPPDRERFPKETDLRLDRVDFLAVSLEKVKQNFDRYELLDDQVRFLEGWFKDTLPSAPIDKLALMRLDGDYYESTRDALTHLYPKLSPGGWVLIDDYSLDACRAAVEDYRSEQGITEPVEKVDWTGVYWKKPGAPVKLNRP